MTTELLHTSLGDIVTQWAGAARILRQYKLDFCCDGNISLGDALAEKGLDASSILEQLESLGQPVDEQDWTLRPRAELVDYIYQRFHLLHREQLPELLKMARRVEAVHEEHPDCPRGLTAHIDSMAAELEQHMQKEEQILFPMLKQDRLEQAIGPIRVMRMEHDDHTESLQRLAELTHDFSPP